jgi:CRISPR-associated protein Csx17
MILHRLDGCAPTPLAHYLKALGILRLVAEQVDLEARGWWEGERFLLASHKDEDELLEFFRNQYRPTPMFNPWGARSGFYAGSSETTSRSVLEQIEKVTDIRFEQYREAIKVTRNAIKDVTAGGKPDSDESKAALVLALRNRLRNAPSAWLGAVIAVIDSGEKTLQQPAVLGTGGSEGSGSYTAAFMKAIGECLIDRKWDDALRPALFGDTQISGQIWGESFGQFIPGGIGSPWDLLLAFEGACVIQSSVVKRSESTGDRWLSSPFFVAPVSSGFSSSARLDEVVLNKGKELPGRGEQWFPLWSSPATNDEVNILFRQGRAITGRRRPKDAMSMARAVAGLGVSRGVIQFVRFGYLQRNNQATHFAVPLGRFVASSHVSPNLACLDDLEAWLPRLRRQARGRDAPSRLVLAERRLADALFAVTQHPDEATRWHTVLLRLADVEAVQTTGSGYRAGPIPRLRPEWVRAADNHGVDVRLALALALQASGFTHEGQPQDDVRRHWLSLDGRLYATSGVGSQQRLAPRADRVMEGRSGIDDAIALVARRLIESEQHGERRLPLVAAYRVAAMPADLSCWIAGEIDSDRTLTLARALMALDARAWAKHPMPPAMSRREETPDDAWLAIRLALLPWPLMDGRRIGTDLAIFRRLESGDASSAVTIALRRLRAAGINATIRMAGVPTDTARLWAAALAFPISPQTAAAFVARLDPASLKETAA